MKIRAKTKKKIVNFVIIALHSIALIAATILLQYVYLFKDEELLLFKILTNLKNQKGDIDSKRLTDKFIFIDLSKDISIVDENSSTGSIDDSSNLTTSTIAIADRKKLAKFFEIVNNHPNEYSYILCDILFENRSPNDSVLAQQMQKANRLIASSGLLQLQSKKDRLFNVVYGGVDYYFMNDDKFYKMPLFYSDSIKSLPCVLYESLSGKQFLRKGGITYLDRMPTLNSVIPNYYFQKSDLSKSRPNQYYVATLHQLLSYPSELAFNRFLKGRIIVLGNFQEEHDTYQGKMPGCMILLDTYLTLYARTSLSLVWWIITLFCIFLAVSYELLIRKSKFFNSAEKATKNKKVIGWIVKKFVSYVSVLIVIDVISFFAFGMLVNILYLGMYFTLVKFVTNNWTKIKGWFKKKKI